MRQPEDDLLDDTIWEYDEDFVRPAPPSPLADGSDPLTPWVHYADDDYDPAPEGFQLRDRAGRVVPRDPD